MVRVQGSRLLLMLSTGRQKFAVTAVEKKKEKETSLKKDIREDTVRETRG